MVIGFEAADGAVIRMLGLVERRGYVVRGIAMAEQTGEGCLTLDIEPRDPGRRLDVLELQLARLHEVRSISRSTPVQGRET
jgi:acetolactate synthase regulatory subunit